MKLVMIRGRAKFCCLRRAKVSFFDLLVGAAMAEAAAARPQARAHRHGADVETADRGHGPC